MCGTAGFFADMLCYVTRDLDASIFTDPPLAKRLRSISKGRDPDAEFRFLWMSMADMKFM